MNKIVRIILFSLALLIILVESFLLIKSFIRNNEALDTNNSLEQELESVSKENNQITTDYLLSVIDDNKLNILDIFQINMDIFNEDINKKLYYAYLYLKDDYDFSKGVSKDVIEKLLLKVFGEKNIANQNIKCDCNKDLLIYKDGIYKLSTHHHNAYNYGARYNKALSLTISNNQYKLTVAKLFTGDSAAYSSFDLNEKNKLFEYDSKLSTDDIIRKYETSFEDFKDNIFKYAYTFEKRDGKFILIKYELLS